MELSHSHPRYDLEYKPTTIVKGQGLCKLVTKAFDSIEEM